MGKHYNFADQIKGTKSITYSLNKNGNLKVIMGNHKLRSFGNISMETIYDAVIEDKRFIKYIVDDHIAESTKIVFNDTRISR
jgi:hypothetical protein